MEKTAQYYWDKVASIYFSDIPSSNEKLEIAERLLSKDEFNHLKELIEA